MPVVMIERLKTPRFAYFQCVGGEKPVANAWAMLAAWADKYKIDWQKRFLCGYDCPNPLWDAPPFGYAAMLEVKESDTVEKRRFNGVYIKEFDTSGAYATMQLEYSRMSEVWDEIYTFGGKVMPNGKRYEIAAGRPYFEQHTFAGGKIDVTASPVYFKLWMPVIEVKR